MAYLADHGAPTRVRRRGSYGRCIRKRSVVSRPVTKDADQPGCVHCKCSFAAHGTGWFIGACQKCNYKNYDPF